MANSNRPAQPPAGTNPYNGRPTAPGRRWTRKRVLVPAGVLLFLFGLLVGTAGSGDGSQKQPVADSTPAPAATVTATETVTAAPEVTETVTAAAAPAPTVTRSRTVRVTVAPAAGPDSGGTSGGGSGGISGGSSGGGATYYANCDAVRAAGKAPLHRGDPGYAAHLDRDGDGVACE
jgi:uncharacterized membrane protein YgcG